MTYFSSEDNTRSNSFEEEQKYRDLLQDWRKFLTAVQKAQTLDMLGECVHVKAQGLLLERYNKDRFNLSKIQYPGQYNSVAIMYLMTVHDITAEQMFLGRHFAHCAELCNAVNALNGSMLLMARTDKAAFMDILRRARDKHIATCVKVYMENKKQRELGATARKNKRLHTGQGAQAYR